MLLNIIKQLNWVDVFAVVILFRIAYIAKKSGLVVELFKLSGTVLAIYLSLHYYTAFSDFLKGRLAIDNLPLEFLDFISFLVLSSVGYLVFFILRQVFYRAIKMEAVQVLDRWGGFIIGICRGILVTGLVIFMLVISSISYLNQSVKDSYSGRSLIKVAPATYSVLWDNLLSKFMTGERFNKTVSEVQADFTRE